MDPKLTLKRIEKRLKAVDTMDRRAWIEEFYQIRAKGGGLIQLRANHGQLRLHEVYMRQLRDTGYVRIIILKARQLGISTWTEALMYDHCAYGDHKRGLVIADDDDKAVEVFQMCRIMHNNNPKAPAHKRNNRRELNFEPSSGSVLSVETCRNIDLGHAFTVTFLHGSEVSRWDGERGNASELMVGIHQTIHNVPGTVIILESTANGTGNWYELEWNRATPDIRGYKDSQYEQFFLPWYIEPAYTRHLDEEHAYMIDYKLLDDEEKALVDIFKLTCDQIHWRRHVLREKCENKLDKFHEQYPATPEEAFIASGKPVFPQNTIQMMLKKAERDPFTQGDIERSA